MRSLGFGGSGHDWSCCLLDSEGELVNAEEALLTRRKYGLGADLLRSRARQACLGDGRLSPDDVDYAVACDLVPLPLAAPFRHRLVRIRHHLSHAYGAFFASPFEKAAVLVADNSGSPLQGAAGITGEEREVETLTYWQAQGREIRLLDAVSGRHVLPVVRPTDYYQLGETDNSLGHLYCTVSEELGFTYRPPGRAGISEDGKTMGLAAYGDDRYVAALEPFLELLDDGHVRLRLADGELRARVRELLNDGKTHELCARRAGVAFACQALLEQALLHAARHLRRVTGERFLVMAGGVALNCVANSLIARQAGFENVFVLPAAGDAGNALGSALYGLIELGGHKRPACLFSRLPFLGPVQTAAAHEEALREAATRGLVFVPSEDPVAAAARELARGHIVGWYEGRSEFGPRALGHRSILADPRSMEMKDRINAAVKRRESFRPFAPIVLDDRIRDLFDVPEAGAASLEFMLMVAPVREEWRSRLRAVVHVDGTARLQAVTEQRYPVLHRLLRLFADEVDVPALLNTSFNIAGEPIVETPLDALECFLNSDIDLLFLEDRLLAKSGGGIPA